MVQLKRLSIILLALFFVACASVQLTPDQEARAAISKAQGQWNTWFDTAHVYYAARPDKKAEWKEKVIPAFQVAKDTIQTAAAALRAGSDPYTVLNTVQAATNNLMLYLVQTGVMKP